MAVAGRLILGVVWSVGWLVGQPSGQSAAEFFDREFVQWSVVGRLDARSVVRSFGSEFVQQPVVGCSVFRFVRSIGWLVGCSVSWCQVIWL